MSVLKTLFIGSLFHLLGYSLLAQSGCPNANLAAGNFSNWSGFTGDYWTPDLVPGIVPGRHTIMTTSAYDPFTCSGLNVIPPGSNFSARLGNSSTGAQGESLIYELTVDNSNALFIYKYAVVLENPSGHDPSEQPEFSVNILNSSGQPIGSACGTYTVYAGQPNQNFQTCGTVTWLPWTVVGLNLQPFIGQTVKIQFTTKDCSLSGHFGYAYVSAACAPLTLDVAYCLGSSNATISAPPGFQSYLWSTGATSSSIQVNNAVSGQVFSCVMTTFSNQGNCTVSASATVFPTIIVPAFSANVVCANTPTQFTDNSTINNNNTITNWHWNFGDGGTSTVKNPTHSFTTPGSHSVQLIVTSDDGCMDTVVQPVEVKVEPDLNFNVQDVCLGQLSIIDNQTLDTLGNTYTWFLSNGLPMVHSYSTSYTYPSPGTYNVILFSTNSIGCSNDLMKQIHVIGEPPVSAGPDWNVCPNDTILLAGSGASNYTWNNGVIDSVPFVVTSSNQFIVTGIDATGCINTDTVMVTYFDNPIVEAGVDQVVCEGSTVVLNGAGALSYVWSGTVIDNAPFIPLVGTTTYIVTGYGANNCFANDSLQIIVNPNPLVDAGINQLICIGAEITLSGSGAATYHWDHNVQNGIPFIPSSSEIYTVIGTTAEGCIDSAQVSIQLEARSFPSFTSPITSGCSPLSVQFTNTSSGTMSEMCTWNIGEGPSIISCGSVDYTYNDPGCYNVTLTLQTALGCIWDTTVVNYICVYPNPIAQFVPVPGTLSEYQPISTMSNSSFGAISYVWNFNDGSALNTEQNPIHEFSVDPVTNHMVELIAISEHGCSDTVSHIVYINEELIFYIPNSFTPNDDGINQLFLPVFTSGFDPYDFNLKIYNRWGEQIFESTLATYGWDGKYKGETVPDGTYNWKIEFKRSTSDEHKMISGHVTVLH